MSGLSHFDRNGAARMVDVSRKPVSERTAKAEGFVLMMPETLRIVQQKGMAKGDVLEIARLAGIMACKKADQLIPLCHSLGLDSASMDFEFLPPNRVRILATVQVCGRTGVEMEALTAVSVAALTIYDMCKAVDRGIEITDIRLLEKSGGASGHFLRENVSPDVESGGSS